MKLYHYLLLFILISSCSKDDDIITIPVEKIKINATSITNENTYSFELNGSFTNDKKIKIIESGFIIDTISEPNLNKKMVKVLSANDNNTLKSTIANLIANKKLFIKSYIKTESNIYYGDQLIHTTLKDNPYYLTEKKTISTQAELLEFTSHHYTSIIKKAWIAEFKITGTVTDLSSLKDLEIIEAESFSITNSLVTNLSGLENLQSINGFLDIRLNQNLLDLKGLDNLQICKGDLYIKSNNNLKNFNSLNKLFAIWGTLIIEDNKSLENFNGLNKLKFLYGISITSNPKLKNLTGLGSLETIAWESFYIMYNESLESLTGLNSLKKVGQLQIDGNQNLKNLKGLENIENISFYINIHNNPNLIDLNGLSNLKTTEYLSIKNNPNLLSLTGLNDAVVIDYLFIENNYNLKNLTKIGNVKSKIKIEYNNNLLSLEGLQNVQTLTGSLDEGELSIIYNNSLKNLKGLEGLRNVYGYRISIYRNENLTSLDGLEKFENTSRTNFFSINDNSQLSNFCALKNYLSKTGFSLNLYDNQSNPTTQTILNTCP
ncbi:hypothetical protein FNW52_14040 [Flavobacterium sp. ZT3R18]|uniref:hypothetical protein n=1 Tax=Flavobacterium sp. ZT3R18 TaxID=2594429 RepID=UPI00117A3F63|nr:hypothetical protein [Flavobacterium sp. ZT3R18]TRX34153.1 hypothetical protein FNW52_14040 [Flavobacterium sp. ZT3R18]